MSTSVPGMKGVLILFLRLLSFRPNRISVDRLSLSVPPIALIRGIVDRQNRYRIRFDSV